MVNYKDLGLVNTREMFKRAVAGGYAIPAFNFNTMEQYANGTILRNLAKGAVEYAKELGCEHPEIVLHLDHGDSFELCKDCIDNGFSSLFCTSTTVIASSSVRTVSTTVSLLL